MYIQTMNLNGTEYKKNYLRHEDLLKGGNINFQMGSQPNLNRGTEEESFPYSFSKVLKRFVKFIKTRDCLIKSHVDKFASIMEIHSRGKFYSSRLIRGYSLKGKSDLLIHQRFKSGKIDEPHTL